MRTVQHGVDTCHHIDIETAVLVVWSRILENGLLVVVALLSAFCLFRREIDIINKKKTGRELKCRFTFICFVLS